MAEDQLNEHLIELIIASMPHDALRNDLYSKPQGYSLADVLKEGRKYEALSAGNKQLNQLGLSSSEKVHAIHRGRVCQNCSTNHKPRQCPAYKDECSTCGIKGHWARCCRKNRRQQKSGSNPGRPSKFRPPQNNYHKHQISKEQHRPEHKTKTEFFLINNERCLEARKNKNKRSYQFQLATS